jgi:dTDP-4-amino-4,6-dideoxygalactose transaminase
MSEQAIPLVDLKAQYRSIQGAIDAAIQRVIDNTSFVLGPEVEAFEKDFATFCQAAHCVAVANGTDAAAMALEAVGVKRGDEVITVAHTFIATAEGISEIGAIPVFVDVCEDTLLMDPGKVEAAITPRTRAIVPVHLYGQAADMDAILAIAKRHGLKVVEDACQAHGAEYKGRRVGTMGDAATFSFYPGKNLGAYGDGGAIVTNDAAAAAWLRKKRNHGRATKYTHDFEGRNSRMDGLQGAVLKVKLPHLDGWNARRRELAARYDQLLGGMPQVRPVGVAQECLAVYHLYVVRVPNRDKVLDCLKEQGIEGGIHYPVPLHLQDAFSGQGLPRGTFPITERAADEILSLPIYPEMDFPMQDRVVATLVKALS